MEPTLSDPAQAISGKNNAAPRSDINLHSLVIGQTFLRAA
jgi:hypothetical protein